MQLPRFREPTRADEMAFCQGCRIKFHHEELTVDGMCEECRSDEDESKVENETKS